MEKIRRTSVGSSLRGTNNINFYRKYDCQYEKVSVIIIERLVD